MALDSDVQDGDRHLLVKFYEKEYGPDKGKDFIEIIIPGNQTLVIDKDASINNGSYKKRFAHHWLRYQMDKNGDTTMSGTRLDAWMKERPDDLNPDQLAELQIFKFQTVEQLANASDLAIQRIGMGGAGLRAKAQAYLKGKNGAFLNNELATNRAEIERLQKEAIERDAAFAKMQAQISHLMSADKPAATQPPKRRGCPPGGWPKKVLADVQHAPATGHAGNE